MAKKQENSIVKNIIKKVAKRVGWKATIGKL